MPQQHVQRHIDLIAQHEQEFLAKRTRAERLGDSIAGFAGSFGFVVFHTVFFVSWVAVNTLSVIDLKRFDPSQPGVERVDQDCFYLRVAPVTFLRPPLSSPLSFKAVEPKAAQRSHSLKSESSEKPDFR